MKYIIGLIIGLIMTAFLAYGENLTYTIAQIQVLLDAVNAKVSTSAGVADAGKMVVLDATGQFDSSMVAGGVGTGTVDTSGTPVPNDFAKFTGAATIEGRSYAETKSDLSLNSVENTAISTWAGSANITTVGTLASGDATPIVSAASTILAGKSELATTAETTTGTNATKAVTPDGLHDMTSLSGAAWLLNENDMASDSSTKVASQSSVKKYVDDAVGAGVADGDKGDVTVSVIGTVWTVDADAITYSKIQNVSATDKVLGRSTAGAGVIEEIAMTAFGRSIIDDLNEAAFKATVNLEIGTDVLAEQTIGIANDNLIEVDGTPLTTEFARFTVNGLEGRTPTEVRGDLELRVGQEVLAYQTIGIIDDNLLEVDDATVADNDYAKFTDNGLEGQTYAQVRTDLNVADGADVTGSNAPQAHAASHLSAGGDAIKLDDLAAPDDNTHLNVSTSAHGLVPKGTNTGTAFLRDDATWAVPAGAGDVAKVGIPANNEIGVWTGDGTLEGDANFTWDGSALKMLGTVFVAEQAAAAVDVAGYGQIWVKTGAPNKLYFTDEDGTDIEIGTGTGDVSVSGTPENLDFARWTNATTIEGLTYGDTRTALGLVIGTNVLAEQTIGIANNNLLEVDDAAAADNQYARFTENGIEGRIESEFKADFNLEIGTDAQKWDADLDTYATITPSANTQSLLAAANYAAMRTLLDVATAPTNITPVDAASADTDYFVVLVDGATGTQATETEGALLYNASSQTFNPTTDPQIGGYDTTWSELSFLFEDDEAVDTADVSAVNMQVKIGGSVTTMLRLDGVDEQVEASYPITAPGMDAGTLYTNNPGSPVTISATVCRQTFVATTDYAYTLPIEPECVEGSGYGKEFCFKARGSDTTDASITITPAAGDVMILEGNANGGAGAAINNSSDAKGDFICISGRDQGGADQWISWSISGTWAQQ